MDQTLKHLWEREYRTKGVPTSFKEQPSAALGYFRDYLDEHNISFDGRLLDLGCGNGRNGIRIAKAGLEVYGIDIAENALRDFKDRSIREGVTNKVHLYCHSIDERLPFESEYFDFVFCLTALENLLTSTQISSFRSEVFRLLKPQGYFLLYFLTDRDGFYGPLIRDFNKDDKVIFIPDTGLTQRVFSKCEAERLFDGLFRTCHSKTFEFDDERFGVVYKRNLTAFIFQKHVH